MKDNDTVTFKVTEKHIKEGVPGSNYRCALAECIRDNVKGYSPRVSSHEIVLVQKGRVKFKLVPLDQMNHINFVTFFDKIAERTPPVTLIYRALKVRAEIKY